MNNLSIKKDGFYIIGLAITALIAIGCEVPATTNGNTVSGHDDKDKNKKENRCVAPYAHRPVDITEFDFLKTGARPSNDVSTSEKCFWYARQGYLAEKSRNVFGDPSNTVYPAVVDAPLYKKTIFEYMATAGKNIYGEDLKTKYEFGSPVHESLGKLSKEYFRRGYFIERADSTYLSQDDEWLKAKGLNHWGDSIDTLYLGGPNPYETCEYAVMITPQYAAPTQPPSTPGGAVDPSQYDMSTGMNGNGPNNYDSRSTGINDPSATGLNTSYGDMGTGIDQAHNQNNYNYNNNGPGSADNYNNQPRNK